MQDDNRKAQFERFKEAARELETDDNDERFEERLKQIVKQTPSDAKVCPECGHTFKGNGWDGIDAHWRSKHEDVMLYEKAWPLLQSGKYPSD